MEQEINVYTSLHTLISQRWKRMLLFATGLTLVVAGILFSLPRYYSATIQVIPESSEGGVSLPKNIAELSSLAGFSMNANNGKDAINPDIYPDIFNSTNFIINQTSFLYLLWLELMKLQSFFIVFHDKFSMFRRPLLILDIFELGNPVASWISLGGISDSKNNHSRFFSTSWTFILHLFFLHINWLHNYIIIW